MSLIKVWFAGLLVLLTGAAGSVSALNSSSENAIRAELNEIAQAYADVYGFSGTVKVVQQGEPLLLASYGLANREFTVPNSPDVRFSINSISKVFTVAALLQLADAGKVKLDAPVASYIPELTAGWAETVTVHHLLTHSSGLPRESGIQAHQNLSLREQIEQLVNNQQLLFAPRSRYEYSNSGIILLGRIIETVSKRPFSVYLTENIIKPLNLNDSGVYEGSNVIARQATPYRITPAGIASAARAKHLGVNPGGGLYSTVDDLHKFMLALEQHKVLSPQMTKLMFQPHIQSEDGDAHGYGWTLKPFGDQQMYFAAGSGYGTKSVMLRLPEQDDFIAITANWGNTPILQLMAGLFFALNDINYTLPDKRSLAPVAAFAGMLGNYAFAEGELQKHLMMQSNVVTLQAIDGKLFLNEELMVLAADNKLKLTYTDEVTISFEPGTIKIVINGNVLLGQKVQ
ncbi:serine hydrolase domain-containing protein [Arsukibacterium indicum]|uniref:Beta-lactamase family protein n=1 Tax=Arsukibacterium indicum TaxID=2848612 RepID=A0ABS6MIU2_9GAMM|nr:serine hydrolase domain-containing protein [Arsukibacterium indicum]MBV2128727.1 beta-lactamase family protein [Arsukibacterium indicum]